ncbi:MAG: hypothetical protein ABUS54_14985 [Actinomycetota bacterium]
MPAKRTESKTSKAPAAKKPAIRRRKAAPTITVSYEDIATRAYYIHLEGNADPIENWLRAEQELVATA